MKLKLLSALLPFSLLAIPLLVSAATDSTGTNVINNGTVYMVTSDGQLRPYTSAGAFLSYGFNNWANVVQANSDDLALPVGPFIPPRDGTIMCSDRGSDQGTCYLISSSQKAGFVSQDVFTQAGFSFSNALYGDVSFLPTGPNITNAAAAHLPGTLLNNNGTIELASNNGTVGIPSMAVLNSWGYPLSDAVPANQADMALPQISILPTFTPGELSYTATLGGPTPTPSLTPTPTPVVTITPSPTPTPTENPTPTPTPNPESIVSPSPQYVIGGSTNQAIATFGIPVTGGNAVIQQLEFAISGIGLTPTSSPITSVTVDGVTAPVIVTPTGATATLTGLNIPATDSYQPLQLPVTVNYAKVGQNGITSNMPVILTLDYIKYLSGGYSEQYSYPTSGNSQTMVVVGSLPSLTLSAANNTLTAGTVEVATVTISANAAGNITVNSLPLNLSISTGSGLVTTDTTGMPNQLVIKNLASNATIPTTDSGFSSGQGGSNVVSFTGGYNISAGQSITLGIFVPLSGSLGASGTSSVTLSLGPSANFSWTDVLGNSGPITSNNTTYLYNYPVNTVSIHN